MAIDLTCDISSKRITPGVINLKEFENGTTSMVWTVSSRYTTGLVDLNDFDAYLNLSIRGHIDQIKLTKVLNVDDSISLTWDVGTLSTFLVGYAKYQIVFKAMGSGSLYVNCPTDANASGTYTVQNPEAIQSLRTYINDHNYRIFIGASGKWVLENTSAETVAYKLIEAVFPSGDNWNNCTVADTTAAVFNTYEALMYISESIASDPSMMAQFPTMLRQWELLLSDKIMSSGLNAVRYEVTEAMFTANSGIDPTYFLMLEDIDTTGKPGLIIGAEAFQLDGSAFYTQIANCNFSDNWAGSAGITVPEAFNGYVVVYYSDGGGRWVNPDEQPALVDSICETQEELLIAVTNTAVHTILWRGVIPLTDFVATAGTFKLIYCQHYSLLGKNSTLVAPAGKSITIYGDFDCDTPATGGYSWTLNSTNTSSIKCKWIRNSGVTGKVICEVGTVLYERLESGLILETNGTEGSESYINQEFWDNTNGSTNSFLSQLRGEWEVGIVYLLNNFCTYGGSIYICLEGYTSDPESHNPSVDAAHWSLFIPSSTTSQTFTNDTTTVSAWNSSTHVLTPVAGVFYVGTALTAMTLAIPSTATAADEFRIKFTIASVATLADFDLSAVTSWIGGAPDLAAGNTYEVSIQDGVGVIGLVGSV